MIGNPLHVGVVAAFWLSACAAPSPGSFIDMTPRPGPSADTTADADAGGDPSAVADDAGTGAATASSPIEAAAVSDVTTGRYRTSAAFMHVSAASYPSTVALGKTIDMWVSTAAWPQYSMIRPDVTGSSADLPRGAVIVREVHDATAAVSAVTAMFKGEPGYNPALGDWGFIDQTAATPTADAGLSAGATVACFACHIPRGNDDFLFGVPLTARPAGLSGDGGVGSGAEAPAF